MKFDDEICKGINCFDCPFNKGKDGCLLAKRLDEIEITAEPCAVPSAQPEEHMEKRTETHASDLIDRRKVRYKLTALVNEVEEIFADIRESEVDDSVCGLCEYDGAYIGQSGDWCNECPGFDRDDCFKLKEKYREEWLKIDG